MPIQTSCFEKSKFQCTQATNFGRLLGNCGTTREGEVDLVRPLKAGFETDPKSTTQPALDPSSKLALAACSKLTLAVPISDLAARRAQGQGGGETPPGVR